MQARALIVASCLGAGIAGAQNEAAPDLALFETTVRASATESPSIAIACVQGCDPLLLCAGFDKSGAAVSAQSLLPLGSVTRLLMGDALHALRNGKLTDAGATIGDTEVSIYELIIGSNKLPDYIAWNGIGDEALDPAGLLACAQVADAAGVQFRSNRGTMAETVLLAPLLRGKVHDDLMSALRTALAPHVPGLDPVDAASLSDEQRGRVLDVVKGTDLRLAQPAALRTLLTAKNVASWWQWRTERELELWTGCRSGWLGEVPDHDGHGRWEMDSEGPMQWRIYVYPSKKAALLICDDAGKTAGIVRAYERCLFGEPDVKSADLLGGGAGGRFGKRGKPLAVLAETEWVLADGSGHAAISVLGGGERDLELSFDGEARRSTRVRPSRTRPGLAAALFGPVPTGYDVYFKRDDDGTTHRLILLTVGSPPKELHAVLLQTREWHLALPRRLNFVPKKPN